MVACSLLVEVDGLGRCATGSVLAGARVCGRIGSEGFVGVVPGWFGFHIVVLNPFYRCIPPFASAHPVDP